MNAGGLHVKVADRVLRLTLATARAFAKIGVRPGTLGAEGYTGLIKSELARWKDVIREANIKAD